jgi:hypothetical protein
MALPQNEKTETSVIEKAVQVFVKTSTEYKPADRPVR